MLFEISLIRKAFKRLHYPVDIIAQCVRWDLAYALSLRNLEEMMAERGIIVGHSTLYRWEPFCYIRLSVGTSAAWDVGVYGQWKYLCHAVDSNGQTIDALLTAKRDAPAALRFFGNAIRHQDKPEVVTIDKVVLTPQLCPRSMPTNSMRKRLQSGKVRT